MRAPTSEKTILARIPTTTTTTTTTKAAGPQLYRLDINTWI